MSARRIASEVWKDIPDFEGWYQVSDYGRIRSLPRIIHNRGGKGNGSEKSYLLPGRILKPYRLPNGYLYITLSKQGTHVRTYVHNLVLSAFVGPRPDGMECCHGNSAKADNHLGNLRWGTRADNTADMIRHGRSCRGERNGAAKLTAESVKEIRALAARGAGQAEMATRYGVTKLNIRAIVLRRTWKHV
jgi:hypothetical protein